MAQAIRDTFAKCKSEGRAAFVTYITCGYPEVNDTVAVMKGLQDGGADIIELGMPFTDPIADGPLLQTANHVALQNGVTLSSCIQTLRDARSAGVTVPIVLMGYLNPLLKRGFDKACKDVKEAGGNGFIIVDMPPEECDTFQASCKPQGLSLIPLISPTTTEKRMQSIAAGADSFIYVVSLLGITGARSELPPDLKDFVGRIRGHTDLPLAVGFGISTREHFKSVESIADGVVIGSKIVSTLQNAQSGDRPSAVKAFVKEVSGR